MELSATRLRAAGLAALASVFVLTAQPPAPAAAAVTAGTSLAAIVVADAESHLGAPYRWGATGPSSFDCSGLVYRVFEETGLFSRIGSGRYRTATAMYAYFREHGLATSSEGRVGDLVVWGGGSHIGIYIGGGRAISALVDGVRIHGLNVLTNRFSAFLHTDLSGSATTSSVARAAVSAPSVRHARTATVVRARPGVTSRRVGLLEAGASVRLVRSAVASHRRWYLVRYGSGRTGWVASWLLR